MSRIFDIADRYVDGIAALDPILATAIGVPGHEREMTDFSPDGVSAIAAFHVRSMAKLEAAPIEDDPAGGPARADRIARSVMLERLGVHLDLFEASTSAISTTSPVRSRTSARCSTRCPAAQRR